MSNHLVTAVLQWIFTFYVKAAEDLSGSVALARVGISPQCTNDVEIEYHGMGFANKIRVTKFQKKCCKPESRAL